MEDFLFEDGTTGIYALVNKCSNKSSLGPSEDAKSPLVSWGIQQLPWQTHPKHEGPQGIPPLFHTVPTPTTAEDSNWRSDFWQGKSGGTWLLWNLEISDVGDPISLVQWRFGAFLELGFFRGKNWGAGLKPVDKDSYPPKSDLFFLVKVDHLPARQQGGSFKMSVLVATFLAACFLGCQNAKRFRKRSIFERQGGRMLLFFWGSAWRFFFGLEKKTTTLFLWWNRFLKSWRICCWFSFPMCMRLRVKKESDERVAEDV